MYGIFIGQLPLKLSTTTFYQIKKRLAVTSLYEIAYMANDRHAIQRASKSGIHLKISSTNTFKKYFL